jgi:cytochrome c553
VTITSFRLLRKLLHSRVSGLVLIFGTPVSAATPEQLDFFEQKIRPVLAAECYECHGAEKQKGGLRLDSREALRKGGDTAPGLMPGEPGKSLLLDAIKHLDSDLKMPSKAPKLADSVIADFEKWITDGAVDPRDEPPKETAGKPTWEQLLAARRGWWSLQPVRPVEPPAVKDSAWSEHPVDRFLLAKMEEHGLAPASDADPRTLLLRLTFALTGLPPTSEEVETFVREYDSPSTDHHAQLVAKTDTLLASPRFGEHWARHWMDLVRYADSHGSEGDPEIPEAWRYRDYLIRAFNADVPLDRLIREHIAGDLLPEPRWNRDEQWNESVLGTAHLRLVEHGFQPVDTLDDRVKVVDSQIDVAMKAFQGLTVTCARCHDHKFDAISQRDYYALFGVFASCRPAQVTIDTPERLAKNRAELAELKPQIKTALAAAWLAAAAQIPQRLLGERARATNIAQRKVDVADLERRAAEIEFTVRKRIVTDRGYGSPESLPRPFARWAFEGDAHDELGVLNGHLEGGAEIRNGRLVLNGTSAFVRTDALPRDLREKTLEAWVSLANLTQRGGGVITVQTPGGGDFDSIVFAEQNPMRWVVGSDNFRRGRVLDASAETANPRDLIHLAAVYSNDGTIAVFRNGAPYGAPYRPTGARSDLVTYAANAGNILFGLRHTGAGNGFLAGEIEEARLYDRALSGAEIAASFQAGAASIGLSSEEIAFACTADEREQLARLRTDLTHRRDELKTASGDGWTAWSTAIAEADKDAMSPLRPWAKLRDLPAAAIAPAWPAFASSAPPTAASPLAWDVSGADYAKFYHYGPGLGDSPAPCGDLAILPEGDRVLAGVPPGGAITAALSRKHGGVFATPQFKVDTDFISIRAFGGGGAQARLIVDGYPLGTGGIFPRAQLEKDEPAWITIDVKYRRGSMAYLEFATSADLTRADKRPEDGRSWFGVERIVAHEAAGKPVERASALEEIVGAAPPVSIEDLAARYGGQITAAIEAWRSGTLTEGPRALLDYFIRHGLLPSALPELESLRPLVAEYRRLEAEIPTARHAPGVLEADGSDAPLFVRGEHTKPADVIPRAYLAVFGQAPFHSESASGRLQLAEAIANPANPLTARVMVNRIWHWLYGRGLVATPDNFGRMGEKPTHPELLDFLAARCVEHGWSAKDLIRFLVTARAFRLSSDSSPAVRERDPADDWLSHFRVRRLEAEAVRDSLLAISGQLDSALYGPPANIHDKPDEQTRRSVYFAIRRTDLSPFLDVFDAPKPFSTLGRRDSTNVPAQSLTLLNDPFVIELSRHWARETIASGKDELIEDRARRMFTRALARPPTADEIRLVMLYLDNLSASRALTPEARYTDEKLWQDYAQSLFNLKEFIYVR